MRHKSSQSPKAFSRSFTNMRVTEATFIHCTLGSEFGKGTQSSEEVLSSASDS